MKKLLTLYLFLSINIFCNAQIIINEIMYNPPESGTDELEYIEFLNTSNFPVNILDYSIADAVVMTFPDTTIPPLSYFVLAVDSLKLDSVLGIKAFQWLSGALRNTDEIITLLNATGGFVDSVHYNSSWNNLTNGNGASLELCKPYVDNTREEHWRSSTRNTGIQINGKILYASAGMLNTANCADYTISVSDFSFNPSFIEIYVGEQIEWINLNGSHNVNGKQAFFPNNPESFTNGSPSSAKWSYIHKFDIAGVYQYQCDVHPSQMKGTIHVRIKDVNYPNAPIGLVTSTNGVGEVDSINKRYTLEGVVYGVNLRPAGLQFTMIDQFDDGIAVFLGSGNLGYTVKEGDLIRVKGTINQFNGLAQILPDSISLLSTGNPLVQATVVTSLNENVESQLVEMKRMQLVDPIMWTNNPIGFTVKITDGTNVWDVRIDNDVDLHGTPAPTGMFNIKGLGTQFDPTSPFLEGYQLMPRYVSDIVLITSNNETIKDDIKLFPNPVADYIHIKTETNFDKIQIINSNGQCFYDDVFINYIPLNIPSGVYCLNLQGQTNRIIRFVKL